jgi:hypothetical protein
MSFERAILGGVIGVGMTDLSCGDTFHVFISIKPYGIVLWCVWHSLADDSNATILIDSVLNVDDGA